MEKAANELVLRLKNSRAKPKITIEHFQSLIKEYNKLGDEAFFEKVSTALAPKTKTKKTTANNPALEDVIKFQNFTGMNRGEFINLVIDQIHDKNNGIKVIAKSKRSLPKFWEYYETQIGKENLMKFVKKVSNTHTRIH